MKIKNLEKAKNNASKLEWHEIDGLSKADALDVLHLLKVESDYANDPEKAHNVADNVLLSLVDKDIVEAFSDVEKWYN